MISTPNPLYDPAEATAIEVLVGIRDPVQVWLAEVLRRAFGVRFAVRWDLGPRSYVLRLLQGGAKDRTS